MILNLIIIAGSILSALYNLSYAIFTFKTNKHLWDSLAIILFAILSVYLTVTVFKV